MRGGQVGGAAERVYHVLEGPQEEERGENKHHLLGEVGGGEELTYEVPTPTIPAPAQPATQQVRVLHTAPTSNEQ